jgi:hypothetical protein
VSIIGQILAYEKGDLDDRSTLVLFGNLIATGRAWRLQGSYGQTASGLIRQGLIDQDGTVNWDIADAVGITTRGGSS